MPQKRKGQQGPVRKEVAAFYTRYPYPPLTVITRYARPDFALQRLNYRLAAAGRPRLPRDFRIWAPGGGTTLPVQLALHFPSASVLATDISARSLDIAQSIARSLKVTNLTCREEDILDSRYRDEFHLVDCAGVLHHFARPLEGFRAVRRALHPGGVANLCVYNARQRWLSDAWQAALALLGAARDDTGTRWACAKQLVDLARANPRWRRTREALAVIDPAIDPIDMADALIHPREVSFELAEVWGLLERSGLRFLAWRDEQAWDVFSAPGLGPGLRARVAALSPLERFQIVECLADEDAPYFDLFVIKSSEPAGRGLDLDRSWRPVFNPSIEFINLRSGRAASSHAMSVLRGDRGAWTVLANGDAREKTGKWVALTPPQATVLERADGTRSCPELLRDVSGESRRSLAAFVKRACSSELGLLGLA